MTLAPINRRAVSDAVAADLNKMISAHPEAFDVLIFKASEAAPIETGQDDVVGSFEAQERPLIYAEPIASKAIELPSDGTGVQILMDGTDSDSLPDEPVVFLIQESDIPQQSVIWLEEVMPDDDIRITLLYLLRSEGIGKGAAGGKRHLLVPFTMDPALLTNAPDLPVVDVEPHQEAKADRPAGILY